MRQSRRPPFFMRCVKREGLNSGSIDFVASSFGGSINSHIGVVFSHLKNRHLLSPKKNDDVIESTL